MWLVLTCGLSEASTRCIQFVLPSASGLFCSCVIANDVVRGVDGAVDVAGGVDCTFGNQLSRNIHEFIDGHNIHYHAPSLEAQS